MKTHPDIDAAVESILSRPNLPNRLQSRANRFRRGKIGLASKLRLLEEEGWMVEITVKPPHTALPRR